MAYTKQTWVNNETLVDEDRMNHIENGIYQNAEDISEINQSLSHLTSQGGLANVFQTANVFDYADNLTEKGLYFAIARNSSDMPSSGSTYYLLIFIYDSSYKKIFANMINSGASVWQYCAFQSSEWTDWTAIN